MADILDDIEHDRSCEDAGCRRCFPVDISNEEPADIRDAFEPRLISALLAARAEVNDLRARAAQALPPQCSCGSAISRFNPSSSCLACGRLETARTNKEAQAASAAAARKQAEAQADISSLKHRLATQGVSIKNLLRDVDQLRAERDQAWQELSDARAQLQVQDKEHAEVDHLTQLAALAAPAIRKLQRLHDQVHGPRGLKFLVDRLLRYVRHNFDCVAVGSTLPCDCGCASVRASVTALLGDAVPFLDQPADGEPHDA